MKKYKYTFKLANGEVATLVTEENLPIDMKIPTMVAHTPNKTVYYNTANVVSITEEEVDEDATLTSFLEKEIADCELSVRALNILKMYEVSTIAELVSLKQIDVLRMRNMGRKTVNELINFLSKNGLRFGTDVPDELLGEDFKEYSKKYVRR